MEDRSIEIPEKSYEDGTNTQNIGIILELLAKHKCMIFFAEYSKEIRAHHNKPKRSELFKRVNRRKAIDEQSMSLRCPLKCFPLTQILENLVYQAHFGTKSKLVEMSFRSSYLLFPNFVYTMIKMWKKHREAFCSVLICNKMWHRILINEYLPPKPKHKPHLKANISSLTESEFNTFHVTISIDMKPPIRMIFAKKMWLSLKMNPPFSQSEMSIGNSIISALDSSRLVWKHHLLGRDGT